MWDCLHRLIRITLPYGSDIPYRYDAFGRRIAKDIDGKTTQFLWQGDKKTTLVQRSTRRKFNNCGSSGAPPPPL